MNFEQIFRLLWARRGLILIATFASLFAATIAGLVIPARYEAHARVILNVVKPDPVTGEVIASQFARAYVQTQSELIRDYRIAGKVVDILGWSSSPVLRIAVRTMFAIFVGGWRRLSSTIPRPSSLPEAIFSIFPTPHRRRKALRLLPKLCAGHMSNKLWRFVVRTPPPMPNGFEIKRPS
jgi:uncharacterized protein involved in exopolysaccharide biosynthesis